MKLKDVNLDKFKIIFSLYETKSISKAAQRLFVTPSAVSQSLLALENQLGKQLFIRQGKMLQPTSDCQKLVKIYEPFQIAMSDFLNDNEINEVLPKGTLRIFMPGSAGPKILSEPFSDFLKKYDGVHFSLDSGSSPNAMRALHNNQVDFAICGIKKMIDQHKWAVATPLFDLSMNLYSSKSYLAKNKTAIQKGNFFQLSHVSGYQSQDMLKWYFKETLGVTSFLPSQVTVYDMNYMAKAVAQGLGIGLLARELVNEELDKGEIIEVGRKTLKHPIFLVHQKQKTLSNCEKTFKAFLLDYFRSKNFA